MWLLIHAEIEINPCQKKGPKKSVHISLDILETRSRFADPSTSCPYKALQSAVA